VTYTNPKSLSSAELILPSGKSDVQTVALTGVIPQLLVDGTAVSLQLTSIGDQTHHLSTVTSFQGAPVTIQSVTITGTNPSDFTIAANSCTPGLVLQGTMSCVIDIAFAPHETGGLVATVDILSSAGTTPIYLYSVGALGPAQVSPTALMFGNQDLLIPSTAQLITVTNPDPVALTLPALPALSGANPSDFTISGSCTTIPANSPCSLKVAFTPTATGTRTASLTIGTGTTVDPNSGLPVSASTTVTFTGVGVASGPPANVHPMRLHFHPRLVGSVSEARKIFLHNPGTTTLILAAPPTITGADPLDFRLSGACTSIAAGGLCELGVQFKPTVEGNRSATLSIPTGGIANRSAQVLLEGNGCVAHHWRPHDHDEGGCEERGDEERDADHR
jgi:hypothetical protein